MKTLLKHLATVNLMAREKINSFQRLVGFIEITHFVLWVIIWNKIIKHSPKAL